MLGLGKHKPMVPAMLIEAAANLALSVALVPDDGHRGSGLGHHHPIAHLEPLLLAVVRAEGRGHSRGLVHHHDLDPAMACRRAVRAQQRRI